MFTLPISKEIYPKTFPDLNLSVQKGYIYSSLPLV